MAKEQLNVNVSQKFLQTVVNKVIYNERYQNSPRC